MRAVKAHCSPGGAEPDRCPWTGGDQRYSRQEIVIRAENLKILAIESSQSRRPNDSPSRQPKRAVRGARHRIEIVNRTWQWKTGETAAVVTTDLVLDSIPQSPIGRNQVRADGQLA